MSREKAEWLLYGVVFANEEYAEKAIIQIQKFLESQLEGAGMPSDKEINKTFPTDNFNSGDEDDADELNRANDYRKEGIYWLFPLAQKALLAQNEKYKETVEYLADLLKFRNEQVEKLEARINELENRKID